MKQAAREALQQHPQPHGRSGPQHVASATVLASDVFLHGSVGFVLLVHRRRDGLVAEEIYYSLRNADGTWDEPDHLSGGLVGINSLAGGEVEDALGGEPIAVMSESESLIYTGRSEEDDGHESVRFIEVLTAPWVNAIEVAELGQEGWSTTSRATPCALSLLAAFPNESLRLRVGTDSPMIHLDGVGPEPDEATSLARRSM